MRFYKRWGRHEKLVWLFLGVFRLTYQCSLTWLWVSLHLAFAVWQHRVTEMKTGVRVQNERDKNRKCTWTFFIQKRSVWHHSTVISWAARLCKRSRFVGCLTDWFCIRAVDQSNNQSSVKPVLNWANVCSPEHTSDSSMNYDSFLNWIFSLPNMVRTIQTLIHSQLACNEMQASARTCGRRAADNMIENVD